MSTAPTPAPEDFLRVQGEEEFTELKRRHRSFVLPMTVFFLLWYLLYVVFAAFVPQVMSVKVFGNVNVGIVWGLLQFVSTFIITSLYVRHANRSLDPLASDIRTELEADAVREGAVPAHASVPDPEDPVAEEPLA